MIGFRSSGLLIHFHITRGGSIHDKRYYDKIIVFEDIVWDIIGYHIIGFSFSWL